MLFVRKVYAVRNVYAATEHYRDAMGFSFGKIWGEPPSFAILKRDNMYVMVKQIDDHKHIVPRWTVSAGLWDMYFWVDDVDALYKEFVAVSYTHLDVYKRQVSNEANWSSNRL